MLIGEAVSILGQADFFTRGFALTLGTLGAACIVVAAFAAWHSIVMKPREAEASVKELAWGGAEKVLDVGC